MAVQTATVQTWDVQPGGRIIITWGDGHTTEYHNLDSLKEDLTQLDGAQVQAEMWLASWYLARDPDMNNVNLIEGKTLTLDISAPNAIKVQ